MPAGSRARRALFGGLALHDALLDLELKNVVEAVEGAIHKGAPMSVIAIA